MNNSYDDKAQLRKIIDTEHGTNYNKNVPLDGFVISYGQSFISFSLRDIGPVTIATITYMYFLDWESAVKLFAYCTKLWQGYNVQMLYCMEHKRKSNIMTKFTHLGFNIKDLTKDKWKYAWKSTNGFAESDCREAFTSKKEKEQKKSAKKDE